MSIPLPKPVVFPLHGITADGKCACGDPTCEDIGKHAACLYRELEHGQPVPRPAPGAGYALKCGAHPRGSEIFVVDLDGEEAARAFDAMGPCPETFTVQSPREGGGWHLYFEHPGFRVKTSSGKLAPHIDIRGDGGIIVGPDSPHKSGGVYTIVDDSPIAPAPEWLLAWLRTQSAPTETQHYPGDVTEPGELNRRRKLYAEYLQHDAPARGPALRGQGDQILFNVVQRGAYDLALPVEDVLELVAEHYDPRCSPMWGDLLEERVHHKAHDAKTNSTRPRAEPLPAELEFLTKGGASKDLGQTFREAMTVPATESETIETIGERWGGWDRPVPPVEYLLDGLIPENKVCVFFAEGGSLKSWAAFALGISVATGEPWLGRRVIPGRALILDYEDGEHEFQRRIHILRGGVIEDLPSLGYKYAAPTLDQTDLWLKLAKMGLRLLIVDTLGSGMPSDANENETTFAAAVKLAGLYTEATRMHTKVPSTVVIVAHANKGGGLRGSTAIRDSADVAFRFEPVSETDDVKRMRMICDKPGPQKRPAPLNLELTDGGLRTFVDEGADLARNGKGAEALDAAILLKLEEGPMSAKELARVLVKRKGEVLDSLGILEGRGEVFKAGYHDGYALDDDGKRALRVREAAVSFAGTASALAAASKVPAGFVEALLKSGGIRERSPGRPSLGYLVGPSPF